jgi:hypothetical protein
VSERILLVEDEHALRTTLGDRLRKAGYLVDGAANGERGLPSPTRDGSPATPSRISCWGFLRRRLQTSGAATRTAARTGCICTTRMTGRQRSNLTLTLGLRYEFNQHMYDTANRLSSVDLSVPGGQLVIASDRDGRIHPSAEALLPLTPIPSVTSASYGVFLNQWAYSVQTAFARNLPFYFTRQVDVPIDAGVPPFRTADVPTSHATGTVGATIMDHDYAVEHGQTWSGGVHCEVAPVLDTGHMGTCTVGADNATVRNVPEPGPGSIRWEVFNLFNRANFDLPSRVFGSPGFARIFSAKHPREMQVGVRLAF